jgi:hypothetical protein
MWRQTSCQDTHIEQQGSHREMPILGKLSRGIFAVTFSLAVLSALELEGTSSHFDLTRSSSLRWPLFRETLMVQAAADG